MCGRAFHNIKHIFADYTHWQQEEEKKFRGFYRTSDKKLKSEKQSFVILQVFHVWLWVHITYHPFYGIKKV